MNKRLGLSAALATVCAALAVPASALGSAEPPAAVTAAAAKPTVRVMPLGDSITVGVGSPTRSSYRRPLWNLVAGQSRYTVRFVGSQAGGELPDTHHEGHSGYLIDGIRAEVDQWIAAERPDVVLLHIGVNDLNRGTDPGHAGDRLKALLDRIFADRPGVTVIMQGVIPTTQGLKSSPTAFNDQARGLQAPEAKAGHTFRFVDPPALTANEMSDRLHPNDAGYQRMADAFFAPLDQAVTTGRIAAGVPVG
ncbi:SGNH/GDSL hydrolase family protein [Kitasatospora brasiliensis]|uniref:SGNH/GDSL hydrolase family protein n=1 Tax=Kitasatospora brasiliensis TaxID=3058040 RepID=UPI00292F0A1B|nr:SGNH/GDSL hydrolase family protein [Kitasatospora sp. K002]